MAEKLKQTTTSELLEALFDHRRDTVWNEFDARYRPVLIGLARKLGLDSENAAEVAQDTLAEFIAGYQAGKYDRRKGRLRSWIIGIARHRVADYYRRRQRQRAWGRDSALEGVADEARLTEIWEAECEGVLLKRAIRAVREESKTESRSLRVFEMVALQDQPPKTVALECGVSIDDVYRIKHRLTKRLRTLVERLRIIYTEE